MQKHMETSQQQTSLFTEEQLTYLPGDSLAKTQATQTNQRQEEAVQRAVERGLYHICLEPSKKSDQSTWLPKMSRTFYKRTEEKTLEESLIVWPQWGTMQSGELSMRAKKVRPIKGQGASWLFTPTASDYKRVKLSYPMYKRRLNRTAGTLPELLFRFFGAVHGKLNLQFYSWMMGYPVDYIKKVLKDTETQ